jgi:mycofactocin glycosyltransferase
MTAAEVSGGRAPGLPQGFRVAFDAATAQLDSRTILGGEPRRIVRLSPAGASAWHELQDGQIVSHEAARLARYLTDAGLVHPSPPAPVAAARADVTVVVPVRDRDTELERCLAGLGGAFPLVVVDDGSADAAAVRAVADRHGARLVRRTTSGGPGAARDEGLRHVSSKFVAFVDSDCRPDRNWISSLMWHFADPLVGAVAPRIVPARQDSAATRYAARFGALDQGDRAGLVRPGARVSYVPTAALVVRRAALDAVAVDGSVFDPRLRYGEDVDLVLRLVAGGWRVRYDPVVEVAHHEPTTWRAMLARRFVYGTSAAPLSRRHPAAVPPLVLAPVPVATVVALAARRPLLAAALVAVSAARISRGTGLPLHRATGVTLEGIVATWRGLGRYACQFGLPAIAVAVTAPGRHRRARAIAAALVVAGGIDGVRFAPARVSDHAAYGAGVWAGCWRERTLRPLRPALARVSATAWRARAKGVR